MNVMFLLIHAMKMKSHMLNAWSDFFFFFFIILLLDFVFINRIG